ncbi:MAG: esterase/lipase family protein [Candidatus Limnocylindrales bacterium]
MGDLEEPRVLIVGGFATSPPLYLPMARRLRARHVAEVAIAPIWTFDWLLATRTGLGPLGRRTAKAIAREWRFGGRQPLLVIGHSAGGILARLAMSPVPFEGYGTGVGEAVGALVTLGTPHLVRGAGRRPRAAGRPRGFGYGAPGGEAAAFLERVLPGAALAPRTGYVTVASARVPGTAAAGIAVRHRERLAGELYAGILGEAGRTARGDGIVPVESAHLDGAVQITLDDVVHGRFGGASWYGSEDAIDRWWPAARAAWRAAVLARRGS